MPELDYRAGVEFRILGPLEVGTSEVGVTLTSQKQRALLAMLLLHRDRVVSTEELLTALWGDDQPEGGVRTLRFHVSKLRDALSPLGDPIVTRDGGYQVDAGGDALDAARFERLVAEARELLKTEPTRARDLLVEADSLWRGRALPDVQFEEFASAAVRRLEELRRSARELRISAELTMGGHEGLVAELEAMRDEDPLREPATSLLMQALYQAGRQAEALAAYRDLRERLVEELGIDPSPEIRRLEERILQQDPDLAGTARATSHLPAPTTSFVGREAELAEAEARLTDPGCRLLTLVGPGGSGKTRAAIELGHRVAQRFPDGAHFAALAAVGDEDALGRAILDGVGLKVDFHTSEDPPLVQVLDYLSRRSAVLVLDNYEHLITHTGVITQILDRAPGCKVLVTSRQRLGLHSEWLHEIGSMEPDDSRELLAERVRQGGRTDVDLDLARRVCELVEHLPLAIELAAAWSPVLSLADIAAEIEQSLDFLESTAPDVAERHRSLRAVFDSSWTRLTGGQRDACGALSVFPGSFTRRAAAEIAGAALPVLGELVTRSFVRRSGLERFDVHPLMQQYAADHLEPERETDVMDLFAAHYCGLLVELGPSLRGGEHQQAAVEEVRADIHNVGRALDWAAGRWSSAELMPALDALYMYAFSDSWYDGMRLYASVVRHRSESFSADDDHALLATVGYEMVYQAYLSGLDEVEAKAARLEEAFAAGEPWHRALRDYVLGIVAASRGRWDEAFHHLELARPHASDLILGGVLQWMGWVRVMQGEVEEGKELFEESRREAEAMGNAVYLAFGLSKLGVAEDSLGNHEEAAVYHLQSREIFTKIGDIAGQAYTISRLSWTSWLMGNYEESRRYGLEGLELFESIGHRWGTMASQARTGFAELALGDIASAEARFRTTLQRASNEEMQTMIAYGVVGLGNVAAARGEDMEAVRILTAAKASDWTPAPYHDYMDPVLADLEERMGAERFAAASSEEPLAELAPGLLD